MRPSAGSGCVTAARSRLFPAGGSTHTRKDPILSRPPALRAAQQSLEEKDDPYIGLSRPNGALARPRLLDLRQLEPQHAVRELRVNLRLIDRRRQCELPKERARLVFAQHIGLIRASGGSDTTCRCYR